MMDMDCRTTNALTPEMKLGLNLVKGAVTVLKTDSGLQVILKNSIREIGSLLKIRDEKLIDNCNSELSVKYRSIFGALGGRFYIVPSTEYEKLSFVEKWILLRNMGLELYGVLSRGKITQRIGELGKAGLEYVVDKILGK